MVRICRALSSFATFIILGVVAPAQAQKTAVDLSGYRSDCGVTVRTGDDRLEIVWPVGQDELGRVVFDLGAGKPLFESIGLAAKPGEAFQPIVRDVDPTAYVLAGERRAPEGRPPGMSVFNVFFDSPAQRPSQAHASRLDLKRVRVFSHGRRATVALGDLSIGPFQGEWQLTIYPGARLVQLEAVVKTQAAATAFLYGCGLASNVPPANRLVWTNPDGQAMEDDLDAETVGQPLAVKHRTIVAETKGGAIACFPPPHQFYFPRDITENQQTAWFGRNRQGLDPRFGFGIRQTERGGGSFVPWYNAPPGSEQHLGIFFLITRGSAEKALAETLRFTHQDRFPKLPGFHTFTSHWHMAIAMAALQEKARGSARSTPDFVKMFKDMGVEMVHLAEFHGDGHPQDPGRVRLDEMQSMFDECRRLSDQDILFIPGEEANVHLARALAGPGKHPGHWLYLFPRPVFWTMKRASGQPFRDHDPEFGPVYHVGNQADMLKLLEAERGLAWTAHARIKASSWAPDLYRHEDFFLSDHWLGAAWKAMPADLSHDRLGRRVLDLFDDMANWGLRKYVFGEVDVFKLDHTHELYGHMNVNYVELDRVPGFQEGWQPLLDSLRDGKFFVTTGEVLIPSFTVDSQKSGSRLELKPGRLAKLQAELRYTFPLKFAEVVSGDGQTVHRQRIDLADTGPFGERTIKLDLDLVGRNWVRLEAWDIACNGAFTQPVWLGDANH